ncbi:MAG TPA: NAD-glutamate dehydrogenase domain-containing protein, partial [Acidimicrobiales bacterium]|nr:NAD-glutamate dehydrogenase domain-containing protein [Acidimicrobiales bacterium]
SAGGGIWSRTSKEVHLSPQAQEALALPAAVVNPPQLVSAILTAPADLLWLGGIGTFVKATNESHADAGDHANDGVRVDADKVRARVVAEGGNLGFTHLARIQYSRRGGKINSDFIDNAAGVMTSDREVNLKILLSLAIERAELAPEKRDEALAAVQDDVAAEVLRQVGLSAAALAGAVGASAADLDAYEALMVALETRGRLDRKVEALPEAEEMATRRAAGAGLIRPELAVLLAYAKSDLDGAIESSELARDPAVRTGVEAYFPAKIAEHFRGLIGDHRLYPQLAAASVGGEVVDRMGITWAHETADEFGTGLAEVAACYWAAREVIGADRRWRQLEDLTSRVDADTEATLHAAVVGAVNGLARTYLRQGGIDVARVVREDWQVAAEMEAAEPSLPSGSERPGPEGDMVDVGQLVAKGVDRAVAESFARLHRLSRVASVAELSRDLGRPVTEVIQAAARLDDALGIPALEARFATIHPAGRWERWVVRSLADDVAALRQEAVERALSGGSEGSGAGGPGAEGSGAGGPGAGGSAEEAIAAFLQSRASRQARFDRLARQIEGKSAEALALAALAVRALADLVRTES